MIYFTAKKATVGLAKNFPSCLNNPITQKHLYWFIGEMPIWTFSYNPIMWV